MEENYKLEKFKTAVFSEVDNKIFEMQRTAIENQEKIIKDNKERLDIYRKNVIETKTQEIKNKYKKDTSKFSMEQKRRIFLKRDELINKMLDNLKLRFIEFTKTENYKQYLINNIKAISSHNLEDINILVSSSDLSLKEDIIKAYKLKCNVKASNDILIGGFAIEDLKQSLFLDETLDTKLFNKKSYLIQNSELTI